MRTIPTSPKLTGKRYFPAFPQLITIFLLVFSLQVPVSKLQAQCNVPAGYIEVGSQVGSDVDDLSEIIFLGTHKFVVRGRLNIDFSWSLKAYDFLMDSSAEMTTKGQVYFSLTECSFKGCEHLWKGIILNSSVSFFMNDVTISDALNAVYVGPSGSGSNISINASYFMNNSVGLRTSGILNGICSVTYCKFEGTPNGLLNGATALAGIFINHRAPGFYAEGNLFQGLQNGVTCFADVYNLTLNNVYRDIRNDSGIDQDNPLGTGVGSAVRVLGGYNVKKPVAKIVGNPKATYDVGPDHEFYKDNFTRCDRGVYIAGDATGIVNNCDFIDCGYGVTVRNTGPAAYSKITLNTFSNPRILGIDFRGNYSFFSSLIQYNKIFTTRTGNPDLVAAVRILATPTFEDQFVKIADNTISLTNGGVGIDLDGTAFTEVKGNNKILVLSGLSYKGVSMHNKTNSCYVSGTTFTGPDKYYSPSTTRYKIGLFLSESENNIISCNYFNGVGVSLNAIDNCEGTIFQHNEFAGGADGLAMGSENGLAALIDDQFATGNLWTGNYTHYDAVNYNPSCYGKFYIYPADKLPSYDNKYWPNKGAVPSQGDFLNAYDPSASTPLTDCGIGYSQSIKLTGIQQKIVNDDYENLPSSDYFKWSTKWLLFDKINAVPELQNAPGASDFLSKERENSEYALWKISTDFQKAFSSDEGSNDLLRASDDEKSVLYDQLNAIIATWSCNPKNETIPNEVAAIIKSINDIEDRNNEKLEKELLHFNAEVNKLRNNLSQINTSNEMDYNMKLVLDIRMAMALDINAGLNNETIKILTGIASQCHLDGGDAVYVAKNLLKSNGIEVKEDSDICTEKAGTTSEKEVIAINDTKVYPNPGSTTLEVDLPSNLNNSAQLRITDILGNEKLTESIYGGHNVINTSELGIGLYLVSVEFKDGSNKTIKWIKN